MNVFFVPGFFGFANLGDFTYFGHVRELLAESFERRGHTARIYFVRTMPTAALATRASRVLAAMRSNLSPGDDSPIHLIGHSSGGLDVRLLMSPAHAPVLGEEAAEYLRRVKTVVTVASPHYGTPLADIFETLQGRALLKVLSLATIYALRTGRLPIPIILRLAAFVARPSLSLSRATTVLDQLYRQLLSDFSLDRRVVVEGFFREVGLEQDLLPQLTPHAMAYFNQTTPDRPGVRYGSVITCARTPGVRSAMTAGLDAYGQATHILYRALYGVVAMQKPVHLAVPTDPQLRAMRDALKRPPLPRDNDGIVPTLSQVWGEIIHTARADHLDVCGHFDHPTHVPPHFDWLISGTGFSRRGFEALWTSVADFILRDSP